MKVAVVTVALHSETFRSANDSDIDSLMTRIMDITKHMTGTRNRGTKQPKLMRKGFNTILTGGSHLKLSVSHVHNVNGSLTSECLN